MFRRNNLTGSRDVLTEHGTLKGIANDVPLLGFQAKLALKLIELGVLPDNVSDFTISIPVDGFAEITCTFPADERLNEAIKDLENGGQTTQTDEPEDSRG